MPDLMSLIPAPEDKRTVALAKAAIRSLHDEGAAITQEAIVARSRSLPQPKASRRIGIGRATLASNPQIAALYQLWRTHRRTSRGRAVGGRTPADIRLNISLLAAKLNRYRESTATIERQLELVSQSTQSDLPPALLALRDRRSRLWPNRPIRPARKVAAERRAASKQQLKSVIEYLKQQSPRRPSFSKIMSVFDLPSATAIRYLQRGRSAMAYPEQPLPEASLLRLRKQDIIRALEVERAYQRAMRNERDRLALARLNKVRQAALQAKSPTLVWPPKQDNDSLTD